MPASGVVVSQEVKDLYETIKMKHKHRYLFMRIDGSKIIVDECKEKSEADYDGFFDRIKQLETDKQCRYAVIDMDVVKKEQGVQEKLLLVNWCPSSASIKNKMIYASTFDTLKSALVGHHAHVQANDCSDLEYDEIVQSKFST